MGHVSKAGRKAWEREKGIEVTRNPITKGLTGSHKEVELHHENLQRHCGAHAKKCFDQIWYFKTNMWSMG